MQDESQRIPLEMGFIKKTSQTLEGIFSNTNS